MSAPFVYKQPPCNNALGLPSYNATASVVLCSPGALSDSMALLATQLNGFTDLGKGSVYKTAVPLTWTGTCYSGLTAYYAGQGAGGGGRDYLFKDLPGVKHLMVGVNISFAGPFPICGLRVCEFSLPAGVKGPINASGVCYPSWAARNTVVYNQQPPPGGLPGGPSVILTPSGPRPPIMWDTAYSGKLVGEYVAGFGADTYINQGFSAWGGEWDLIGKVCPVTLPASPYYGQDPIYNNFYVPKIQTFSGVGAAAVTQVGVLDILTDGEVKAGYLPGANSLGASMIFPIDSSPFVEDGITFNFGGYPPYPPAGTGYFGNFVAPVVAPPLYVNGLKPSSLAGGPYPNYFNAGVHFPYTLTSNGSMTAYAPKIVPATDSPVYIVPPGSQVIFVQRPVSAIAAVTKTVVPSAPFPVYNQIPMNPSGYLLYCAELTIDAGYLRPGIKLPY